MFVAIISFPSIRQGKDSEFLDWFAWSNDKFSGHAGFIRRVLLKPLSGGNYTAIVEHESYETFLAMQSSDDHTEAGERVRSILDGGPSPVFYETVAV